MTREGELQVQQKQEIDTTQGEPIRQGRIYVPQVDIFENDTAIFLQADLPGARKEDVDIDLRDGVLTLTAYVNAPQPSWEALYREHEVGGFTRKFRVGERIDQGAIKAELKNGVLHVELPKSEAHKPRRITVN